MTGRPRDPNRTPRDCSHKTGHKHGTYLAYLYDACRCTPCTDANTAYASNRRKQIAYGRWGKHFTDAQPVREHIEQLRAQGMGINTIADASGVSRGAIARIIYGEPGKNRAPSKTVLVRTATGILAVTPTLDTMRDGATVDGTGTRRRLQALAYNGWTQNRLSRELGCTPQHVAYLTTATGGVTAANARRVRDLYKRLWDVAPTPANKWEAGGIRRAKDTARKHQWAPGLAWDDIDDPAATPDTGQPDDAYDSRRKVHLDDIDWWLDLEPLATAQHLADRLGVTRDAIQQACRRAGRQDLLDQLARNNRLNQGEAA